MRSDFIKSFFEFSLDSKHRVSVPREYRDALKGVSGSEEIWMSISPYGAITCLPGAVGHGDFRDATVPWLRGGDPSLSLFRKHLFATARIVEPDANGRVVVPPKLCEMAGLGRRVHWVGEGNWFELWDAGGWDASWQELDLDALKSRFNEALTNVGASDGSAGVEAGTSLQEEREE